MSIGSAHYPIGRPAPTCAATGRTLEEGELHVAVLAEDMQSGELARFDYSNESWESGARPEPPFRVFGFWHTTAHAEEKSNAIDASSLAELFGQLEEQTDENRIALRYVLCLLLIRKRVLVLEGTDDNTLLVRRKSDPPPPEGPELQKVIDPGLDDDAIDEVSERLIDVLERTSGTDQSDGGASEGGGGD